MNFKDAKIRRIRNIKAGFSEIMQSVGGMNDRSRNSMYVTWLRIAVYGGVRNKIHY